MRHGHARRLAALTLTAVAAAGLLAACGSSTTASSSSSSSSATAAAGGPANRAKLVACLKQHGVTLPTRPPGARQGQAGAGSGTGPAPGAGAPGTGRRRGFFGGGAFANPKFQAAFKACGVTRVGRRGGFARGGTPQRAAITKFVTCVSAHGYTLPKPNFTGKGPVFPAKIETNPKFISASRACQSQLRPPAAAAPGGTTSSGA
jgi:hypothetical protein